MPVRDRRPGDDQPLFRAVNEQRLIGPVGREEGLHGTGEAPQAGGTHQGKRGPIARAVDKAQKNNWVYPSMADKARERGLLDKADEVFDRVKAQLSGK